MYVSLCGCERRYYARDGERGYSGRGYAGITAAFIEVGVHAHVGNDR